MEESSGEVAYDPAAAASSASSFATPIGVVGSGGRGRGRGRGRGGGGIAIEGIAELDASLGRPPTAGAGRGADGAPPPPAGGGKPLPKKESKDFRGPDGLFKKADWTCTACGNVNWERRQTCNKCQNQKPNLVTTDEAREGHGGGFNERQDRASVATVEVDEDGYDDFGRKKIKALADKKAKEMAALARLRKSFGGGMLGGTSLAPTGKPPVPGQFDDAAPATSVTTYDKFGRPNLSGIGRSDGGAEGGGGGGNAESAVSGREKEGRGSTSGDKGREWDRNRDRDRRDRGNDRARGGDNDRDQRRDRSRSRSRERSSRRRRSRSRSRDRDRRR
eukprot:jgi/Undpi1/6352/HiC_scaffold_20.g08833.m1